METHENVVPSSASQWKFKKNHRRGLEILKIVAPSSEISPKKKATESNKKATRQKKNHKTNVQKLSVFYKK